ncbi:MAG: hypothetical protein ACR2N7_11465 [Acidimicrobiia bacterium]
MIIDCDSCSMQHTEVCDDCVVTALVGTGGVLELAAAERSALEELSRVGLVSPIRLAPVPKQASGGER